MQESENGEELCEIPSSGHDTANTCMNSLQLQLPAQDEANSSQHPACGTDWTQQAKKAKESMKWRKTCWGEQEGVAGNGYDRDTCLHAWNCQGID